MERVEIRAADVGTEEQVVIDMDYLRQISLILVQVRSFMERAETGALTAEDAKARCEEILTAVRELHESVEATKAHLDALKLEMDAVFQEVVNENLQKIIDMLAVIAKLAEDCRTYRNDTEGFAGTAESCKNRVEELHTNIVAMNDHIDSRYAAFINTITPTLSGYTQRIEAAYASGIAVETHISEMETRVIQAETSAKTSETNAKASETLAVASATQAAYSEAKAKTSEANAKTSEERAAYSESQTRTYASSVEANSNKAAASEAIATASAAEAKDSADNAAISETNAQTYAESMLGIANFELDGNGDIQVKELVADRYAVINEAELNSKIDPLQESVAEQLLQIERLTEKQNEIAEDVRLLKHFAKGELYTEYTDDSEAHEKSVPKSADEKALLNSVGGKSVVVNQLVQEAHLDNVTLRNNTMGTFISKRFSFIANHKYLLKTNAPKVSDLKFRFRDGTAGIEPTALNEPFIYLSTLTTNNTTTIQYSNYTGEDIVCSDLWTNVIDLTTMFGAGNEPTLEQCQQIFTDYIPYTEPTIKHLATNEVVVRGKNLFDEVAWAEANGYTIDGDGYINGTESTTTVVFDNSEAKIQGSISMACEVVDASNKALAFSINYTDGTKDGYYPWGVYTTNGFTTLNTKTVDNIKLTWGARGSWKAKNIMVCAGSDKTFVPYRESTIVDIPTTEADGYSAGSVYNERDFANGKRVQRVAMLALNVDDMNNGEDYPGWKNSGVRDIVGANKNKYVSAIYELNIGETYVNTSNGLDTFFLFRSNLTQTEWKQQYAGKTFHFLIPLDEPIETDLTDEVNPLIVEGNGSVEFVNTEQSKVPIPSSISYCVSTKEGL